MSMLCALPIVASLFLACAPEQPLAVGYVEGEYVRLAPLETAKVTALPVRCGDRVEAGQTIALLETEDAEIALSEAEAALAQAEAQHADLRLGKRPEEIAVLESALRSARIRATEALRVRERTRDLHERGIATQAELDNAATSLELADAEVGQAEANLAVAALPAREETIKAAEGQVERAMSALRQARWRLEQRTVKAPVDGRIDDIIRNVGDLAGVTAPIVSLLPDGAVKLKLYVPERLFASVEVGTALGVDCNGCPKGLTAQISYIAPEPEFTPPVIYSLESRQKLVHLVEARPDRNAVALKPGQIVDVWPVKGEGDVVPPQ